MKNSERTIKDSIDSIIDQCYSPEDMEILIVDGGSIDRTLEIITDRISKTNIKFKIFHDKGKGLGIARQMLLNNTCNKYIVMVDGDVKLSKYFVQKQVKYMEKNSNVAIAGARYKIQKGNLVVSLQSLYHLITQNDAWIGSNIWRVKALKQIGGFDRNIKGALEDLDIMVRTEAAGWKICINPDTEFYITCRETWKELWNEHVWFGYGGHFISHKHKDLFVLWRRVPPAIFIGGLRCTLKAYPLTHQKISFLIPLQLVYQNIAWWFGFIKGHFDGYGHEK